jgi:ketosteroid isomerase-like protein
VLAGAALPAFGQETDQAIHDELRGVLTQIETAINSGDYDKMLPVLSERIRATPIDQEFLASRPDVSAYFVKWFGPGGRLKKLDIHLAADAKTELSADKTWGTVWGQGVEKYILSDGRNFDFKTRWTATVAKEDDGRWRIRSIHIGTNFLDNPILNQAESALSKAAVGGGLGGLIVGGLLGWFVARKKKS